MRYSAKLSGSSSHRRIAHRPSVVGGRFAEEAQPVVPPARGAVCAPPAVSAMCARAAVQGPLTRRGRDAG
eukprot:scaffold7453_cov128-Isochrysis_galbana.AAC.11